MEQNSPRENTSGHNLTENRPAENTPQRNMPHNDKIGNMPRENKMGTMPVGKLILNMSIPMMISMLVQALYNVVDSIFVAQIDEYALTAVSMTFPIQNFMISLAAGTCVGVNALLSKSLGAKDHDKANKTASTAIVLGAVSYILILAIGIFFTRPFYTSQTDNQQIIEYGMQYGRIICCLSIGVFMQLTLERLLQSTGMTFYSMITQSTGAIINMVMDPILIFGLFGFPKMGVAGAAAATVFGQIAGSILGIYFNIRYNKDIRISLRGFRPDPAIIGPIYAVGIPSIIMMSIGSIMNYGMNLILISFASTAVAVFGVYFKLQSFIFMPVFGLNSGMVPIIAFNYGAGNRKRVISTIKYSVVFAVSIMIVGVIIFNTLPAQLLGFFNASKEMLAIGVPALRIISISFTFAGYCIVIGSVFQSLGNGVYTLINSFVRQIIFLLPAAWLLSKLGNVDYVWYSFPIAEISSVIITTVFLIKINKDIISKLGE